MLMASSSAGLWSERTRWGAAVSSPLVTMLLTITLCNVGVLPAASPAYDTVNQVNHEPRCLFVFYCPRPILFLDVGSPRAGFAADDTGFEPCCLVFHSLASRQVFRSVLWENENCLA